MKNEFLSYVSFLYFFLLVIICPLSSPSQENVKLQLPKKITNINSNLEEKKYSSNVKSSQIPKSNQSKTTIPSKQTIPKSTIRLRNEKKPKPYKEGKPTKVQQNIQSVPLKFHHETNSDNKNNSHSKLYKWEDEKGTTHYTNYNKIPKEFLHSATPLSK